MSLRESRMTDKQRTIKDRDPLPEYFDSIEEMAEFWDTHDSADYEDALGEEVELEMSPTARSIYYYYPIEKALLPKLLDTAAQQGVSVEALINQWGREKLAYAA